ncbi:MAG TPA: ferritin-like domain-containing protein [Sphingomonadaceae bacterium]|nr:ferritin-like domain-containing protein [Sphingomonadaceae bacterium]
MNYDMAMIDALTYRAKRRESRREFFKTAGSAAVAAGSVSLLAACGGDGDNNNSGGGGSPPPPTGTTPPPPPPASATIGDPEILNFALNLEYLEAEFYSFAVFGRGLDASLRTGIGTPGTVTPGRQVNFTDPVVAQYALEIAQDEIAHVRFLRAQLGAATVAEPSIDVGSSANGAFSAAARAAGLVGAGAAFDPYANDENFLLGAFLFEDVGVTAYKGASPLITSKVFLEAAAGILAAEAYHAGLIRTILFRKGLDTPSLRSATVAISNARDSLDGASDIDQGIVGTADASNIVPTDANALAFSRNGGQVLNIVYLTPTASRTGGFFPNGVNGAINTSQAN